MGLEIRDISKDVLSHKDLQFVSNQNKEKSQRIIIDTKVIRKME